MSALPAFALRPLAFPSHRFGAVVDLSTGRVVALRPLSDAAASGGPVAASSPATATGYEHSPAPASAGGNAPAGSPLLAGTARPLLTRADILAMSVGVALSQLSA